MVKMGGVYALAGALQRRYRRPEKTGGNRGRCPRVPAEGFRQNGPTLDLALLGEARPKVIGQCGIGPKVSRPFQPPVFSGLVAPFSERTGDSGGQSFVRVR